MTDRSVEVTALLQDVKKGKPGASDALMDAVYAELRVIADRQMSRFAPSGTLQPTALVHEAYLKLFGKDAQSWENRRHFYWTAARAMHDILVDRARKRCTRKRGGGRTRLDLDADNILDEQAEELLETSRALKELEDVYESAAQVVMLRFFGGLTHEETGSVLGVSQATVRRRWTFARAWLHENLSR